jgi:hypothetical protein
MKIGVAMDVIVDTTDFEKEKILDNILKQLERFSNLPENNEDVVFELFCISKHLHSLREKK